MIKLFREALLNKYLANTDVSPARLKASALIYMQPASIRTNDMININNIL